MRRKVILTVLVTLLVIDHLVFAEVIGGSSDVSPPPFWENSFGGMTRNIERAFTFTTPSGGPYIGLAE